MDRLADSLIEQEELNEQGIRAKMEVAALSGDRFGALKLYERWAARLRLELSASPSPLMQRFAEDLRRGIHAVANQTPKPTAPATAPPLVARREQYQSLYAVWEKVLERRSCHALVRGERGVGKTTLVSHLLAALALDGAIVARVKCYEMERDIPYAAITSLLRDLTDNPGAACTPPEALAELAFLIPAIRERYTALPSSSPAQGESARLRLTEAAFQLIIAVAEERPVVIAVDDFHLADDASLAVLHLVMRRLEDERVMVVLVGRGREAARSPNAGRLLDVVADLGVATIDVRPLGDDASEQLLDALLGGARPDTTAKRVMLRAARGYPLVLGLLAQEWTDGGTPTDVLMLEGMTPDLRPSTPARLYASLLDRTVQRLDSASRPVLDLAAVLGARMNDLRFYSMLGLSPGQTVGALEVLVDHGIIGERGSGLEFVNDLVRTHVYLRLPSTIRRQMHALIVDELLRRDGAAIVGGGLELAWHLIRCGRLEEGAGHLLRGAREAIDRGATWEAERALRTGADTLSGEESIAARLLLAEALLEQGRESETREVATVLGASDLDWAHDVATAIATSAMARRADQPVEEALEDFRALLGLVREARVPRARAIAARGAAVFALKLGGQQLADQLLHATHDTPLSGLSTIDLADLRYARATALYQLRHLEASEQEAKQAIAELHGANIANSTLLGLYCGRGAICCARGEYHDAIAQLEVAHDIARKIGNTSIARACLSNLSLCCFRLGDVRGQVKWGELALGLHYDMADSFGETTYTYHLAIGYALSGETHKAFDALAAGDSAAGRLAPRWARQSWLLSRADVLTVLGRRQDAFRAAREAIGAEFNGLLSDSRAGPYARWKARLARTPADAQEARDEVLELLKRSERYDALDRAEILAAATLLGQLTNNDVSREALSLRQTLSQLPAAVGGLLRNLGFLDEVKPLGAARMTRRRRRSAARPREDRARRQDPHSDQHE
jgi:tetratricopeptide (TPR) repeat protein